MTPTSDIQTKPSLVGGAGRSLLHRAGTSFLLMATGTGIGFLSQVLLARLMGVEQFGIYAYVLSWMSVLAAISRAGWDATLVRFVAAYRARETLPLLHGIIFHSKREAVVVSGAVGIATAIIVTLFATRIGTELWLTFVVSCLILPFFSRIGLNYSILQAFNRVIHAQLPEQILRPVLLALFVGILVIPGLASMDGPSVMVLNLISMVIAATISEFWSRSASNLTQAKTSPNAMIPHDFPEWRRMQLPAFLMTLTQLAIGQIDTVMVGLLIGTTEAGIYSVVARIASLIVFGLIAVNAVVGPQYSQLYANKKIEELQRIAIQSSRGIVAYTIPIALGAVLGGPFILRMFGSEFVAGATCLTILVTGQAVNSLTGSVGLLMTMTGNQMTALRVLVVFAILNAFANFILVSQLGMQGAAIATAATVALQNLTMAYLVWQKLGIRTTIF